MEISLENENEHFLDELNAESASDEEIEGEGDLVAPVQTTPLNLTQDNSESSSDGEEKSIEEEKVREDQIQLQVKHAENFKCTYFEDSAIKCKHLEGSKSPISQNVCPGCDFKNEIEDSLSHMAFWSPEKPNDQKANWKELLKVESPTASEETSDEVEDQILDFDKTIEPVMIDEEEEIDQTFQKEIDETFQTMLADESRSLSVSLASRSPSMFSETTLFGSDSDDEAETGDFASQREKRSELKRKKALEEDNDRPELKNHEVKLRLNRLSLPMRSGEAWFCPRIDPPPADLNLESNSQPIAHFYKSNKKFKLVNLIHL